MRQNACFTGIVHKLSQTQFLPVERKILWDFISVPQNLDKITPPEMSFEIIGEHPEKAFPGLLLEYRILIPVIGWTRWLTEIKYLEEGFSFMDEQRVGPYKLWLHFHKLEEVEDGTRMTDQVHYQIPYGPIGEIAHFLFVKKMLKRIFDYRRKKLEELFPNL